MYNRKVKYIASILSLSFTVFSSHKSRPLEKRNVLLFTDAGTVKMIHTGALFCGGFSGRLVCFLLRKKHTGIPASLQEM